MKFSEILKIKKETAPNIEAYFVEIRNRVLKDLGCFNLENRLSLTNDMLAKFFENLKFADVRSRQQNRLVNNLLVSAKKFEQNGSFVIKKDIEFLRLLSSNEGVYRDRANYVLGQMFDGYTDPDQISQYMNLTTRGCLLTLDGKVFFGYNFLYLDDKPEVKLSTLLEEMIHYHQKSLIGSIGVDEEIQSKQIALSLVNELMLSNERVAKLNDELEILFQKKLNIV